MSLFKQPGAPNPTEPPEDDPSECLGNAIFWGVLFWGTVIFVATWFIVSENKKEMVRNIALTLIVIDLMCAWVVAAMIKKWFKQKNLAIALSLFSVVGAGVLWLGDLKVWAIITIFIVCATDFILLIKMLAENWWNNYDRNDGRNSGDTRHKP